jgi:hypothetical protein
MSTALQTASLPALRKETKTYDVVVAGGGMSGVGAAVTAARHGASVALIQDRPVLGGNGSKEIRVWLQGASGGANAVWFRETGLMEELLLENQFRNPEGNAELWDSVLLDKVLTQKNLDLYLNTSVLEVETESGAPGSRILSITGLTLHSERVTKFVAPYFIDCTGDGTVGYLAGAPYMTGRESKADFGETLAPAEPKTCTLGGSILFLSKDVGHPVKFHPPSFAHKFTKKDFRSGRNPIWEFDRVKGGFWWVEWGGELDTIHDNEQIKVELLKIAYGIFDYIKNDPEYREKYQNYTLEWVGTIPGKRESRRFIGDHIMTQQDIVERRDFPDAIAFGGWNLDDHAPKGFFDDHAPASMHTQIPGLYNIPLRSLYSKTVPNLLFAGRNVSCTHIALTSVRVMLTCAQMGEAVGAAAAYCAQKNISPRTLATGPALPELRERLLLDDHYIVGARSDNPRDLARRPATRVSASSQLQRVAIEQSDSQVALDVDRLVLFPASAGTLPHAEVLLTATADTVFGWQVHRGDTRGGTIPAATIVEGSVSVTAGGTQWVRIPLAAKLDASGWCMLEIKKNPALFWHESSERLVGLKSYAAAPQHSDRHANTHSRFSCNRRRQLCIRLPQDEAMYAPENVVNGLPRPFKLPNLWISQRTDFKQPEWLELAWAGTASIREVQCLFDSDLDRHLTNTWISAPYAIEPDLVKDYDIELKQKGVWRKVAEVRDNHQRRCRHVLPEAIPAEALRLFVRSTNGTPRAQVYAVQILS